MIVVAFISATAAALLLTGTPGAPRTIASDQFDPEAIVADAESVYWTAGDAIFQSRVSKGSPSRLVSSPWTKALALDASRIYWRTTDGSYYDSQDRLQEQVNGIWSAPRSGGKRLPKRGKLALELEVDTGFDRVVAADSDSVYGFTDCCTLVRVPRAGGAAQRLFSGGDGVPGVALTDEAVFLTITRNLDVQKISGAVMAVPLRP